jgi:hypothetical protein
MRTDDLISTLSRDAALPPPDRRGPVLLVGGALALSTLVFAAILPVRADLASTAGLMATSGKWLAALAVAGAGGLAAWRLRRPGADAAPLVALAILLPLVALLTFSVDLWVNGVAGWSARMLGTNARACLMSITAFSLAPLAAFLVLLRGGAVTSPSLAGLAAGLASAGLGAVLYALHCTEDSPLFVLAWYSLAALVVSGAAALASRYVLRW